MCGRLGVLIERQAGSRANNEVERAAYSLRVGISDVPRHTQFAVTWKHVGMVAIGDVSDEAELAQVCGYLGGTYIKTVGHGQLPQ